MKKKILFALLLLSMFIAPVFAEESSFQFLNEFDLRTNYWEEINFTKTEKTADGNYVVSQGSYIKLVKPSGRTIWSQELSEITGNDRVDFYIEDEYVYVTYTSFGNVHVVIYELSTGEYVDDYFGSGGFFIDKIGDNFIVADWEGIYLYDENWNSINASINTNLFSSKSIFVEDNKVYTLSCQAAGRSTSTLCTPYLVIYNENLEVESSKKVVGDEFNNVDAFFKVNNDFYITHFNVYKIASNGSSTMVIDAEENGTDYLSGAKVDNYIVLGGMENKCVPDKGTKNSCQDKLLLSVYDTDFNYLEDLAPLEDNEDTSGIVKNITPTEKGFIAKWVDWDGEYIGVTEYSLKYNIETKTDGNGNVSVNKIRAVDGDKIVITVEPKPGYVLSEMTIIDANGNKITTTDNTFVMPASDVIVEAKFIPKNPGTDAFIATGIIVVAIVSGILVIIYNNKKKQYE